MLYWQIKSVVTFVVLVLCSNAFADSPVVTMQAPVNTLKSAVTAPNFTYPTYTFAPHELTETGVMFVYNEHILNYFGDDRQKLIQFIDASIEHNNQAFVNSNIPIKRVVTGLIYVGAEEIWSANDAYTDRLHGLAAWQRSQTGQKYKQQFQYSYLVSLAGYSESMSPLLDEATMLGQAFVGDNVSWVSPYSTNINTWLARTLAHELGHNDGFKHSSEGAADEGAHIARFDAAGYRCGDYGSIMHISGLRIEPFFSDTQISLSGTKTQESCGVIGQANSAQVYRDLINTSIANAKATFSNITSMRPKTGVVSIHANVASVSEGQDIVFDIIFEGADAGDSVNVAVLTATASAADYQSEIVSVVHDGTNNVYSVTVPTYIDSIDEDTEFLSYTLLYPNGVTIDNASASIEAKIIDSGNANANFEIVEQAVEIDSSEQPIATTSSVSAIVPNTGNLAANTASEESRSGGSFSGVLILLLCLVTSARLTKKHTL